MYLVPALMQGEFPISSSGHSLLRSLFKKKNQKQTNQEALRKGLWINDHVNVSKWMANVYYWLTKYAKSRACFLKPRTLLWGNSKWDTTCFLKYYTYVNSKSLYSIVQKKNIADHLCMLSVSCQLRCSYIVGSASRQSETCGHYCPHNVLRGGTKIINTLTLIIQKLSLIIKAIPNIFYLILQTTCIFPFKLKLANFCHPWAPTLTWPFLI